MRLQLFENAIYLFSVQPFAPSDAIVCDGTRYTVSRITLLSIELLRGDGAAVTVTTAAMRSKQVHNVSRSGKLQEELQFEVDRGTPHDKLEGVAHYVQKCVQDNPRHFYGTYTLWWSAAIGDNLRLSLAFEHESNGVHLATAQQLPLPARHDFQAATLKVRGEAGCGHRGSSFCGHHLHGTGIVRGVSYSLVPQGRMSVGCLRAAINSSSWKPCCRQEQHGTANTQPWRAG